MGSQWPVYTLNNKDRFIEVHSYSSLFFLFILFFLAAHSTASYKSCEIVNQTQLFTSKQLSHPLLKLKHNSAATGVPSSTWPGRVAVGTQRGCSRLWHSLSSAKAKNPPPPWDCPLHGLSTPETIITRQQSHLNVFAHTDRLSNRLLQCKEMPINTWSYFHNAKRLREMTYFQRKFEQFNNRGKQRCFKKCFWGDNSEVNYLWQLLKNELGKKKETHSAFFSWKATFVREHPYTGPRCAVGSCRYHNFVG